MLRADEVRQRVMTSEQIPVPFPPPSHVLPDATCPGHRRPSAPQRLQWSGAQNPGRCGRRGLAYGPQTATLWARWSSAATAAGSSPRWWSWRRAAGNNSVSQQGGVYSSEGDEQHVLWRKGER